MPLVMERTSLRSASSTTSPTRSGLTSLYGASHERNLTNRLMRQSKMTTAQAVGAVSREAAEWYAIDCSHQRNVRRLPSAYRAGNEASRWGRVRALQRLLTHSYQRQSSRVRRVTENNGKENPGVDQEIWDTPEKKTQAVTCTEA